MTKNKTTALPACVREMGCLCALHAAGAKVKAKCNASEHAARALRCAKFADTIGKAIAKLARTDLEAARRMSDLAQAVAADIRAGRV